MTDLENVERLAKWWWSLTDEQRAKGRAEFIERMRVDPDFAQNVHRLLNEEKPYRWSTVWDEE